jgi:hypothetical protein
MAGCCEYGNENSDSEQGELIFYFWASINNSTTYTPLRKKVNRVIKIAVEHNLGFIIPITGCRY